MNRIPTKQAVIIAVILTSIQSVILTRLWVHYKPTERIIDKMTASAASSLNYKVQIELDNLKREGEWFDYDQAESKHVMPCKYSLAIARLFFSDLFKTLKDQHLPYEPSFYVGIDSDTGWVEATFYRRSAGDNLNFSFWLATDVGPDIVRAYINHEDKVKMDRIELTLDNAIQSWIWLVSDAKE